MAIVPNIYAPTPPFAGRGWSSRLYPGDLSQASSGVRSVLTAPRGHRFSRPGSAHPDHRVSRSGFTRTIATRPRPVAPLPPESPQERRERLLRQMQGNPRVAHMLEHGPTPRWFEVARQRQEKEERQAQKLEAAVAEAQACLAGQAAPAPPRGRHRAPRQWRAWPASVLSSALLFGLTVTDLLVEGFARNVGFLP